MKPLRLLLLLALCPVLANAAECHYFWTTDCFEIRDPRTRDITHHVLLSEQRFSFEAGDPAQCPAELDEHLTIDQRGKVLRAFNKRLKKLPGCRQLETLTPEVFADEGEASEEWQRLATERNFKSLHLIRRLPD
ncbi:hypothetical protein [Alcanivorax sp. 1008]|uniref:hypothetical protein n=1 Tax=Alcanivorax sp. 1008 TaxID=2816853 RepID=UPI001E0F6CC4|nr:hypothetical protein [Alcanivorax sp. 1008]MCC1495747.1 hypothetical protein [Alcanivorax sp. 1008]